MATLRIPASTYRLQFNQSFTFRNGANLIPYLHDLGITDCYTSPYLKAFPGSSHGYDVVDPTSLNPEIGNLDDYHSFVGALTAHGMGHILDIVPNHMGIANSSNPWWQDVLENGPSSRYADFFDIDWHPVKPELENKVLLPILGDQYGIVLENQEITLSYEEGQFFFQYYEHRLPIDPNPWVLILSFGLEELTDRANPEDPHFQELQSIITALGNLPGRNERHAHRTAERCREKEVIKRRLAVLTQESPLIAAFIEENLRRFNGTKGVPRTFDFLDALLSDQAYRLAFWRVASEEINYRRFFDVNQLAAIRMENPLVFQEVHQLVFDFLRTNSVTGLRIDHVDGLYDPRGYLSQWQRWAQKELGLPEDSRGRSIFLIVEKILGKGEPLSEDWPIYGTTGYDFLSHLNNLFVDSTKKGELDGIYTRFVKDPTPFKKVVYETKKVIMGSTMSSEMNALGHQLNVLSEKYRWSRDFTLNSLTHAIREIIACFPVYRTYASPDSREKVTERDRAFIQVAIAQAKRRNPTTNSLVFDFIQDLLLKIPEGSPYLNWSDVYPFVMKFQQMTSPVTAKGVEDTAYYIYNRLISLNEVGGEPAQFGISLSAFHTLMQERQQRWPFSLSATSTHDTKRSEDVRSRLNVLSELPKEWKAHLSRWHKINKKKKSFIEEQPVPNRNEEYFLYQTLIGAWPFDHRNDQGYEAFRGRIQACMLKALREAKIHTSWINPNEGYENGALRFIEKILDGNGENPFLIDFLPFQDKIAQYGMYNSLSQVVIKIAAPGIPDFYQGTELWDLSLVDPDNRRQVDYAYRRHLLQDFQQIGDSKENQFFQDLLDRRTDGRIKFYVTMTLLNFRKRNAALFVEGDYVPLEGIGEKGDHLCAFQRNREGQTILAAVPRFLTTVIPNPSVLPVGEAVWGNTLLTLPKEAQHSRYHNILTGQIIESTTVEKTPALSTAEIFQHLPVALLERLT